MTTEIEADLPASAPEPVAPQTINDIASSAIDLAEGRAADRAAGKAVDQELPNATTDRARDEHGKFARASRPPKGPAETPGSTPPAPRSDAAAAPAALQAPARWSDADKANFARLPPDAQKLIADQAGRQDADYTRKTQDLAEQRKSVEPVLQALQPHTDYLNQVSSQLGQHPAQMISTLIATERTLRTSGPEQRAQTLAGLIRAYPVDLQLLNRALGQAPQVQAPDPIINDLRQQLGSLSQQQRELLADRQQRIAQDAKAQIEAFRAAKDEQGQPRYPHFDAVRAMMAPYVERGMDFDQAYMAAAKPIVDAIAARDAAMRQTAEASDKERAASVARARQASSPRAHGTTPSGSVAPMTAAEAARIAVDKAYG